MSRIRWSENLTCPRCGKMGKVMFSGLGIPDPADGEKDRVERLRRFRNRGSGAWLSFSLRRLQPRCVGDKG
jgi:hypothetical protein